MTSTLYVSFVGECHIVLTKDRSPSPGGAVTSADKTQQRSESSTSGVVTGDESDQQDNDVSACVGLGGGLQDSGEMLV